MFSTIYNKHIATSSYSRATNPNPANRFSFLNSDENNVTNNNHGYAKLAISPKSPKILIPYVDNMKRITVDFLLLLLLTSLITKL